jgi:hypothetical protein
LSDAAIVTLGLCRSQLGLAGLLLFCELFQKPLGAKETSEEVTVELVEVLRRRRGSQLAEELSNGLPFALVMAAAPPLARGQPWQNLI